jgi:MbtH protein
METNAPTRWTVVVNARGEHAIMPAERPVPGGWSPAGFEGTEEECASFVETSSTGSREQA